jgi:hypothetical protein
VVSESATCRYCQEKKDGGEDPQKVVPMPNGTLLRTTIIIIMLTKVLV